jgi:hypothetical protein
MATATIIDLFRDPPNLAVALDSARAGFPVFPCHATPDGSFGAKSPRVSGGHRAGTTDEAQIKAWWAQWPDSLVGLGLAEAGVMAIDADRHGGPDGVAAWQALCADRGFDAAEFPAVATPGDGLHIYMRRPAAMEPTNGEGSLPSGINVRGAGYTIAPGCVLPDGRSYEPAAGPPLSLDIPEAPQWLVGMIGAARRVVDATLPACELDTPAAIERATAYLKHEAPPAIEGQGGDNTAYRVACAVKDAGISEHECLGLMLEHYQPRCASHCGLEDEAAWLEQKVASAYAHGQNPPGFMSAAVDMAGVEIIPPPSPVPAAAGRMRFLSDVDAAVRPSWLLKGWLPKQGVVLLAGQSRIGKTFLSLELAGALATGGSFFGRPVRERVGVLILAAEGGGTIAPRLEALRLHRLGGIDAATLPIAWAEISDANEIGAIVAAAAVEMRERFGLRLGLVAVDTVAAAFGVDENDAQLATSAMKALGKLASDADVLVVAVAHYGKSDGAGVRGSSAWTASADVILAATGEISETTGEVKDRKLALTKSRYAETGPISDFDLRSVNLGLDEDGDPISAAVIATVSTVTLDPHQVLYMDGFEGLLLVAGEAIGEGRTGVPRKLLREHCYGEWFDSNNATKKKRFERIERRLIDGRRIERCFGPGGAEFIALAPPIDPASLF